MRKSALQRSFSPSSPNLTASRQDEIERRVEGVQAPIAEYEKGSSAFAQRFQSFNQKPVSIHPISMTLWWQR